MIQPIGYLRLYRELASKPIWENSTPEQKVVLITLLMMANFKEKQWEWKGEKFNVKQGQFVTSLEMIAKQCGKGISIQNVRTALVRFEKLNFLTNESTKTGRLITIANWDVYQSLEEYQQSNQQRPNKDLTTREERKKDNKELKHIDVFDYWNQKAPHKHKELTKAILDQLNSLNKLNSSLVLKAIDNYCTAYNDESFYYSHVWTLDKFIKQKNGYVEWLEDGKMWVDYSSRKNTGNVKQLASNEKIIDGVRYIGGLRVYE